MQESTKFSLDGQLRMLYIKWPTPNIIETNKVTHMKICTEMQFVTGFIFKKMKQNQEPHLRKIISQIKKKCWNPTHN
jgi:hypothetical protein